jgi:hypothetical protein
MTEDDDRKRREARAARLRAEIDSLSRPASGQAEDAGTTPEATPEATPDDRGATPDPGTPPGGSRPAPTAGTDIRSLIHKRMEELGTLPPEPGKLPAEDE